MDDRGVDEEIVVVGGLAVVVDVVVVVVVWGGREGDRAIEGVGLGGGLLG